MSTIVGSDSGNYDVQLGFWINWSFGKIRGTTLTVTRESGGLLIAFLAIYVSASGQSFWRVGCFFLHRYFSSTGQEDGLYHQRQAILRNSDTAVSSIFSLIRVMRSWRRRAVRPFRRTIPVLLFALTVFSAFVVAGIFSSQVTTNSANEVLLSGKKCGLLYTHSDKPETEELLQKYYNQLTQYSTGRGAAYMNYASQCYSVSQASQSENCRPYIKPRLGYKMITNASCPFDPSICRLESENLILDSGFLDSHSDFGINMPPKHRFQFRTVSYCSPIVTRGFSQLHQNNDSQRTPVIRYFYGTEGRGGKYSYSYEFPIEIPMYSPNNSLSKTITPDYIIRTTTRPFFRPIPQLAQPDSDMVLYFLSAPGIVYVKAVDDPWFAAHTPAGNIFHGSSDQPYQLYTRDEPVGVLACYTQYQFCNPQLDTSSRCEPLNDTFPNRAQPLDQRWPDKDTQAFVGWAKDLLYFSLTVSPRFGYTDAGSRALLIRPMLQSETQQGTILPNQWQLEMERLFQIYLASLQGTFVDNINGPSSPDIEPAFFKPNDTAWEGICRNQKIVSALYYSFNVLGMAIILVIGGFFIFLDFSIESISNYINRYNEKKGNIKEKYAHLEWNALSTLQLQRQAHEALGHGTWSRCAESVPVTERGERLGILSVDNEFRAVLVPATLAEVNSGSGKSEGKVERQDSKAGTNLRSSSLSGASTT